MSEESPYAALTEQIAAMGEAVRKVLSSPSWVKFAELMHELDPGVVEEGILSVAPDDKLWFTNGREVVEVERLTRTIANAALAADRLKLYVNQQRRLPADEVHEMPIVARSAAARYASTLASSLGALVKLMGGEEVERLTPDWLEADRQGLKVEERGDKVIVYYDTGDPEPALRLGETYRRIKELRDHIRIDETSGVDRNDFQNILNFIKEGK